MRKVVLCMAVMAALAITSAAPAAQTYTQWNGLALNGLWNDAGNWSVGVPEMLDSGGVQANPGWKAGFKTQAAIAFSSGVYGCDVLVAGGGAGAADFVISGATINVSEYVTLAAATNDIGYLQITAGALNTGVNYNNTTFYVTQKGTGTLDMSGGTIICGLNYPTPAGTFGNFAITSADLTGVGTVYLSGTGNIYAANLVRGSGASALVTIASTTANIWLTGDKTGDAQTAVDDGWLVAGSGLQIAYTYDDLSDVTQIYAIPEPATVCLLGLGLLGLIRRK
jgi:hypothetical protein